MRIGVDAGRILYGRGGVATYTRELIRSLLRLPVDDLVLFDLDNGVTKREVFERAIGKLPKRVSVASAVRRELEGLDLFHAPGFAMPPAGAPHHVFTLHDLTVLSHPHCHTLDNRVRTLTSVADALVRGATLLAVSEATRGEAVRLLSLPAERLEVVPPVLNPVFSSAAHRERDVEAVRRLGVEEPFVLAVASLEPRKNMDRLLDAWCTVGSVAADTQLVVVASDEWMQRGVRRRIQGMGDRSVIKISHVSEVVLAALYRRARTFVFPSLAEGFGLPVVEAMACGAPVITSKASSLPEVAGNAALLVDPEDTDAIASAIARLLDDQDLRRDLRDSGIERARQFAADTIVPRLMAVYNRAVMV